MPVATVGCVVLTRRSLTTFALCCAAGLVALWLAVGLGWTASLDGRAMGAPAWSRAHGLVPGLRFLEVAFGTLAMTAYVGCLVVTLLLVRHARAAALVLGASSATALTTGALKLLTARPRPPWQSLDHPIATWSFPSGHASAATALVTSLVLVTATWHGRRDGRRTDPGGVAIVSAAGATLVVLVGVDRLLLGRHYPTDVIGGVLLGLGVACLMAVACGLDRAPRRQWAMSTKRE